MMVRPVSLVLSSVVLLATVSGVNAQNLPAEGPLSITFTATQIPPAKPMPIGAGKEFVMLNMAMTASNDTGNPVLHKMGGRCQLWTPRFRGQLTSWDQATVSAVKGVLLFLPFLLILLFGPCGAHPSVL